jgi:clan AA aspartic protease
MHRVPFVPPPRRNNDMGVFTVKTRIKNWQNRYLQPEKRGREVECDALVDSGAAELALPTEMIEQLKLDQLGTVNVYTADGGQHEYRVFGIAEVQVQGRVCHVRVIELPHGAEPLLGAVPLEEMDWHIAPLEKALFPNPKSPDKPLLPLG